MGVPLELLHFFPPREIRSKVSQKKEEKMGNDEFGGRASKWKREIFPGSSKDPLKLMDIYI